MTEVFLMKQQKIQWVHCHNKWKETVRQIECFTPHDLEVEDIRIGNNTLKKGWKASI